MTGVSKSSAGQYLVLAAKPNGGRTLGLRRAQSYKALSDQLRRDRLVALKTWTLPQWAGREDKVSLKDQGELHMQLSQLLVRGVPLVEALEVTASAVAQRTRPRVERMKEMVSAGSSFSDACAAVDVFDKVTIAVYRSAERTGDLGGAAKQLANTTRRQLAISGKVGTLMIYPVIVLSLSLLVATFMITFIVPRIGHALEASGETKLPWLTRAMVDVGLFIQDQYLWVLLGVVVLAFVVVATRKQIVAWAVRASRVIPVLRDVVMTQESARFFTVMAAMTRGGVTLADALGVASGAISHPVLSKQLSTLRTKMIEGGVLRVLIEGVDALPLSTRRLLIAAERSGDLETAFETLADDMAVELDRRSTRLLAALEPVLIVLMFLVIGTLVLSIMIPLIKSTSQYMAG